MGEKAGAGKALCTALAVVLVSISVASLAVADPPGRVNFQGMARDAGGTVLDGPVTMVFRLYDDPVVGTVLWEETYDAVVHPPAVTVSAGLFTVALGDPGHRSTGSEAAFQGVFANHAAVYLGVEVGEDTEMTPRISVVSAPFAVNSEALGGMHADDFAEAVHTHAGSQITGSVANATDADKLDGFHSTAFATSSHDHAAADVTSGILVVARGGTGLTAPGMSGNLLTSNGSAWTSSAPPTAASTGAVVDATNATLTRSGAGTGASPYKLALNLSNANTWTGAQTFSANTSFPGSGIWNSAGKVGIGTAWPAYPLDILAPEAAVRLVSTATGWGPFLELRNNTTSPTPTYQGLIVFNNAQGTVPGLIGYLSSGAIHFSVAGAERMRISSTGLAIGTTAPAYGLRVDNPGSAATFVDTSTSGLSGEGMSAWGRLAGGYFACTSSSGYAYAGYSTYKINGSGTVSFVQNHPTEKDKVIVYACPEGDEVATYTRGTAKLVNGEARVKLGETFQWVTNPDIGLTAHLTPRGEAVPLAVESLSTTELVVRGPAEGPQDMTFDYIVYGLRIGFEESSIVQEKQKESFIPSFKGHRERYAKYPALRAFNALERFKTMESAVRGAGPGTLNLSRAEALKASIHEYDPEIDPPVHKLFGYDPRALQGQGETGQATEKQVPESMPLARPISTPGSGVASRKASDEMTQVPSASLPPSLVPERFPVCETVDAGDVLVADPAHPGAFCLGRQAGNPRVVGLAVSGAEAPELDSAYATTYPLVQVATSGFVACKVDAAYGPIAVGDLLATSPTPGHAQKAVDPKPGTVLGKALEAMDAGVGTIRILVMLR